MKISIVKQEKTFKPIVLNITIESEEELCALWHRMNVAGEKIDEATGHTAKGRLRHEVTSFDTRDLFLILDNYVGLRDLYGPNS